MIFQNLALSQLKLAAVVLIAGMKKERGQKKFSILIPQIICVPQNIVLPAEENIKNSALALFFLCRKRKKKPKVFLLKK
jgi:hypothetical protein